MNTVQELPQEIRRRLDGEEILPILKHFRTPSLDELIAYSIESVEGWDETEKRNDPQVMWYCRLSLESARILSRFRDEERKEAP